MKRFAACLAVAVCISFLAPVAQGALRFAVIDGTNGKILSTDLAANDLKVTRTGAGSYTLTFKFNILFFMGNVQAGGPGGDATSMIFTSVYDTKTKKIVYVTTYGVAAKSPVLDPMDGRITILVNK
ncbi:MAG TPA: hypothetical protein VGQ36_10495 [Thermoanaerobaculia bacterium]|jgi:hypothetical protein|nr:hypothetical protein [Thermoanaerobaculia bacterium]